MTTPIPTTTKQWTLANKPTGAPVLQGEDATFKLQTANLPALQDGQMLGQVQYFSNDTGLRNFIQSTVAPERFYVPTVPIGSPMRSGVIVKVIQSKSEKFQPGDLALDFHLGTWSEYIVLDAEQSQPLGALPPGVQPTHFLGALGASGIAAYSGLHYAAQTKPEHTVVISVAAGATGSVAVQIAAKLIGAKKVIGIAGTDAKCAWVKDTLGAHECLNYKSPTFAEDLKKATPEDVDVYFDNAGGEILDLMLTRMKKGGQVTVCGAVSQYNSDQPMALRNWFEVVSMRIQIRGFIMLDYMDKVPAILGELMGAIGEGKLVLDGGETIVEARIEEQPEIWARLFSGGNQGKSITKLFV
ncbi:uncharacterized protein F5Z01DRAFT_102799 [Emericellopsis atlantica]|uniref:Dehydrogenase FUB6 n=1 Tax=Emericellopsis atlantica TaxID=2614577 RepID=A0A9P7ZML8_9HYPO|nr:uncharacterized protein F5Z01DRAFT_102799 [Emericellopsis atlantica]KAG9254360.1 hypothetical protein F5Z01DRAFT_102799 [Emericellopsis atlantica]